MQNLTFDPAMLEAPRRKLIRKHRKLGTWRRVAQALSEQAGLEINPSYPFNFAAHGLVPANPRIQHALGIRVPRRHTWTLEEVNRRLASDRLSDLPAPLLAWALEHREVMS
jgi:hypothetical protein